MGSVSIPQDTAQIQYLNHHLLDFNSPGPRRIFPLLSPTPPSFRKFRPSSPSFRKWPDKMTQEPTRSLESLLDSRKAWTLLWEIWNVRLIKTKVRITN